MLLLTIGCAQKKMVLKKEVLDSSNSISLDAYENGDGTTRIRSILNSKESTTIHLDGKAYEIAVFKSIIDTLKGEYTIKVDTSKKMVRLIRMH